MNILQTTDILLYPKLEPWQEKAADYYFEMGTGAWPDDLHALSYRITKRIGMCGEVMLQICKMYVWLRTKEFMDSQELKHYQLKEHPPVHRSREDEDIQKSTPMKFDEMWGFKDEVIKRWSGKDDQT